MKNIYLITDSDVAISVESPKYGRQTVYIDLIDLPKVEGLRIYVWGTPRHNSLYAMIHLSGTKHIKLHRHILDNSKGMIVDHVNGDGLDNRRANLRLTDSIGNNQNSKKRRNAKTSKYKGVSWNTRNRSWVAQIQYNYMKVGLGYFKTEQEAADAYDRAAKTYHAEFARTNITP